MKAKEPLSCLLQQPKGYSKDRSIWKQVHVLCAFLKRALLVFIPLQPAQQACIYSVNKLGEGLRSKAFPFFMQFHQKAKSPNSAKLP